MSRIIYVALLLVGFCTANFNGVEAKSSDDGKGIILKDLLSQPFRIALLRGGGDAPSASIVGGSTDGIVSASSSAITSSLGLQNIGVTLAKSTQFPKMMTSEVFVHPFSVGADASDSFVANYANLRVDATFDTYDNYDILKARKVPREVLKAEGTLRKTRLGQIRDTSMTMSLFGSEASGTSEEKTLLALGTLDPYLPGTHQLLGGRVGGLTQASKYEATGHVELDGLMTADRAFYESLVAYTKKGASSKESTSASSVHGTFTLTFVNQQEFTLRLKPLASSSATAAEVVTFYGFATPPVTADSNSVASALATVLGIGSGNSMLETLFDISSSSSGANFDSATTVGGFTGTIAKLIALPMRPIMGDLSTDDGEDKARSLVESVAFVSNWLSTSWPLLLAVFGVFIIKTIADFITKTKEASAQIKAHRRLVNEGKQGMTEDEKRKFAKEAEAKVAALLAKANSMKK